MILTDCQKIKIGVLFIHHYTPQNDLTYGTCKYPLFVKKEKQTSIQSHQLIGHLSFAGDDVPSWPTKKKHHLHHLLRTHTANPRTPTSFSRFTPLHQNAGECWGALPHRWWNSVHPERAEPLGMVPMTEVIGSKVIGSVGEFHPKYIIPHLHLVDVRVKCHGLCICLGL